MNEKFIKQFSCFFFSLVSFSNYSIFNKTNCDLNLSVEANIALQHSRHLLDDSVLEDKPSSDATSTGSSEGVVGFETDSDLAHDILSIQGCIRRKTLLKDGKKPAVASWQRYWLQIWANSLVYFPPKSFKGYVVVAVGFCVMNK